MDRLLLHFLNVGHGDCTFVEFPSGRLMMVDINNSKSLPADDELALAEQDGRRIDLSKALAGEDRRWEEYYQSLLVDPYDYYLEQFKGRPIFRYVQTHPDMDHMSGLHRFFWQERVPLVNFWDVAHTKDLGTDIAKAKGRYSDFDRQAYNELRQERGPNGSSHRVLYLTRGSQAEYYRDDHVGILSPSSTLVDQCNEIADWNNMSYVLRIEYGGRSVILGGDAEDMAWDDIEDDHTDSQLACDVLKASHHGRNSGFSESAVSRMEPGIVICSVGKKPDVDASGKYSRLGAKVVSTRRHGTIRVSMWEDGEVWVDNPKGQHLETLPIL